MEKEKVNQFLMTNAANFPPEATMMLRQKLESLPESAEMSLLSTEWKSPMTTFLLAFLLGGFGADRFYLGETGLGVAKLLTCGGVGIWALVDLFTAFGRAKKFNWNKMQLMC